MMPEERGSDLDWETIHQAVDMVRKYRLQRMDGFNWTVYRAGKIVRIDIKEDE